MTGDRKLLVCAALSVAAHFALARGLGRLPHQADPPPRRRVTVAVVPPPQAPSLTPPPAEPEAPRPPAAPPPRLARAERPRAPRPQPASAPREAPPAAAPVAAAPTPATAPTSAPPPAVPVFGVTMASTSQAGRGPAMAVGNSLGMRPGRAGGGTPGGTGTGAGAGTGPVAAFEVTTMPLPQGRCAGAYTDEAKQAGVEGTVVLDLVVGEDGRTRDIRIISGLPHGLSEAAIAALRSCHFSPGEKSGTRVAVRVRGFKIQFLLENG